MPAFRFLLLGYGIAAVAGVCCGFFLGWISGWLIAWLGGAGLSLLFAWGWYHSERASEARLFAAWDRDLIEEMNAADLRADLANAAAEAAARREAFCQFLSDRGFYPVSPRRVA